DLFNSRFCCFATYRRLLQNCSFAQYSHLRDFKGFYSHLSSPRSSSEAESSSRKRTVSEWVLRTEAGQSVLTVPYRALRTACAFRSSGTTQLITSLCRIAGIVNVRACSGTSSRLP